MNRETDKIAYLYIVASIMTFSVLLSKLFSSIFSRTLGNSKYKYV